MYGRNALQGWGGGLRCLSFGCGPLAILRPSPAMSDTIARLVTMFRPARVGITIGSETMVVTEQHVTASSIYMFVGQRCHPPRDAHCACGWQWQLYRLEAVCLHFRIGQSCK